MKRTGSHMQRESQEEDTERQDREERGRRLVTAVPPDPMGPVRGCSGLGVPQVSMMGSTPTPPAPLDHPRPSDPSLCCGLGDLSRAWPSDKGPGATSTWLSGCLKNPKETAGLLTTAFTREGLSHPLVGLSQACWAATPIGATCGGVGAGVAPPALQGQGDSEGKGEQTPGGLLGFSSLARG